MLTGSEDFKPECREGLLALEPGCASRGEAAHSQDGALPGWGGVPRDADNRRSMARTELGI
jgi:hypothetical protein